ncbi:MAG: YceI family protein [Deltaproteobacteria bacterium]|nr:YceI family protein [Deltaproteobacteria bacterium]
MKTPLASILFCAVLFAAPAAFADHWNLPQALSPANTKVTFEVDSTWHLVEGQAKQIEGRVWLEDPKDPKSVRAKVSLPVAAFDTDSENRDEKMRKVMHAEAAPAVVFTFSETAAGICAPDSVSETTPCRFEMPGKLSISNVEKDIVVHAQIAKQGSAYQITGVAGLKWADYGVEDPSILIATLDDDVKVEFTVTLNPQG